MSMEELFATAVDRLEKNLPVDDVMALCTTDEERAELRELLFVVEDMVDLALQPAPAQCSGSPTSALRPPTNRVSCAFFS